MPLWYSTFLALAATLVRVLPLKKGKGVLFKKGQQEAWQKLRAFKATNKERPFWFHCASLGEFEQGKPILLALKARYPQVPVVVTFFSPSGYEARKTFLQADCITYLPLDAPGVAHCWVQELNPRAVFWVKYEFWLGYLAAIAGASIPLFLLAALPKAKYFTGFKSAYYLQALEYFDILFVQYQELVAILPTALQAKAQVVGDPRFDNVLAGIDAAIPIPELEAFYAASDTPVLLVGSAWPQDMDVLLPALKNLAGQYRLLIFPHEMHPAFIAHLQAECLGPVSLFTDGPDAYAQTLVVNAVGFLARSYRYADVAWVGGGFGKGLHNILEAAAWGKPVLHGPKTQYFPEATRLQQAGGGYPIESATDAANTLLLLLKVADRATAGAAARAFIVSQAGATAKIVARLPSA